MTSSSDNQKPRVTGPGGKAFYVRDFLRTNGVSLASPDHQLSPDDTLIRGNFLHAELRSGLFLHLSDVTEERAFTATSALHEGLSCIFFLDGAVELKVGDRSFAFRGERQSALTGVTIMNSRRERFERSSRRRQYLRHLVISASPEWLDLDGMADFPSRSSGGGRLLKNHLADHQWNVTPHTVELIRQVLAPSPLVPQLLNLYLEGRAVEIVAESLSAAIGAEHFEDKQMLVTGQDRARLRRAFDIIEANLDRELSVEAIAREAGISASGLQKLFRRSQGTSVFEYVRERRLQRAFLALKSSEVSVQEASLIAGYSDPANFATAFRKRFGCVPSQV